MVDISFRCKSATVSTVSDKEIHVEIIDVKETAILNEFTEETR